ncbi:5'-3' DNA helicase ZGRF1-like isoform X1 [Bolinopsis microptera]|uniref:5'-3' DNA helicase ZGRF1-like isoform X1 n=1 Tax=Bolinopsis microptera TaxID=2820187 RepID=UPI003079E075
MKTYKVLYTHQKTKKSKVWQDGVLKEVNNTKLSLIADNGRHVESVFTKSENIIVGDEIESDGHLILIDDIAKENSEPSTITTTRSNKEAGIRHRAPPIRPKFVSKKFTPPAMRRYPVVVNEDSNTQSRQEQHSENNNLLLGKFQSRKVVRNRPSLVTSLSRTFQSTSESSNGRAPFDQSSSSSQISSYITPNISSERSEKGLELREIDSDLSVLLEMPGSQRGTVTLSKQCFREVPNIPYIPSTPAFTEQRSIESIFKVLNGASSGLSPMNNKSTSKPDVTFEKIPEEHREQKVSEKLPEIPSTCNFDAFDDSIFSPSPPKGSSGLSKISQDNNQSFSSSLEGFIDNKIEEIARTVPEKHNQKIKPTDHDALKVNSGNKNEDMAAVSCYETVDYFDIFGDDDGKAETFGPTVLQLSTQEGSKVGKNTTQEETVSTENRNIEEDQITNNGMNSTFDDSFDVDIPSCSMWDIGEELAEEVVGGEVVREEVVREEVDNEEAELERQSKRRKLGNVFRNPRTVTAAVEKPAQRRFTVPFAGGGQFLDKESNCQLIKHELKFGKEPQKRHHLIPESFSSPSHYKTTMLDVIYEHLNVSLAKVCERYSRLTEQTNTDTNTPAVKCPHGAAKICTVSKDGPNKGRQFYTCKMKSCDLFKWAESTVVPTNPQERFTYYTRQGLSLYKGCRIKRKQNSNLYMLQLSTQDKHVNYNKDDIWIIDSASPQPSIMKSTFYGPTSSGQVELRLLNCHVPRCGAATVDALQALRAVAELEIVSALDKINTLPLLPSLVSRRPDNSNKLCRDIVLSEDTEEICISMCREYHLNEKQEEAVLALINSLKHGPPILCVHGVFGSGKSYLLAVIVLILVRVLSGPQHRLLITSTTNVAVDNILIKLLELGFEHFVRVGSVKRIHKKIAPYVLQHQDCETSNFLKQDQSKSTLSRYQVVGTTCASSPSVSQHDIVLFDEVSQVTEPSSLLPLIHSSCKRLLLVILNNYPQR